MASEPTLPTGLCVCVCAAADVAVSFAEESLGIMFFIRTRMRWMGLPCEGCSSPGEQEKLSGVRTFSPATVLPESFFLSSTMYSKRHRNLGCSTWSGPKFRKLFAA